MITKNTRFLKISRLNFYSALSPAFSFSCSLQYCWVEPSLLLSSIHQRFLQLSLASLRRRPQKSKTMSSQVPQLTCFCKSGLANLTRQCSSVLITKNTRFSKISRFNFYSALSPAFSFSLCSLLFSRIHQPFLQLSPASSRRRPRKKEDNV